MSGPVDSAAIGGRLLTREDILGAPAPQLERVEVPEWGGAVFVREMTAGERDSYEAAIIAEHALGEKGNVRLRVRRVRARLLVCTVFDAQGTPMFAEADIDELAAKPIRPVQRIYNAAARLNALSDLDIKELAGNSDAIPGEPTPSS